MFCEIRVCTQNVLRRKCGTLWETGVLDPILFPVVIRQSKRFGVYCFFFNRFASLKAIERQRKRKGGRERGRDGGEREGGRGREQVKEEGESEREGKRGGGEGGVKMGVGRGRKSKRMGKDR